MIHFKVFFHILNYLGGFCAADLLPQERIQGTLVVFLELRSAETIILGSKEAADMSFN